MACPAFEVTVQDVAAALEKVKDGIAKKNGSLTGDQTKGAYAFSDRHWIAGKFTIKGSYTVKDRTITITNSITADRPNLVTCAKIEEEIRNWLK